MSKLSWNSLLLKLCSLHLLTQLGCYELGNVVRLWTGVADSETVIIEQKDYAQNSNLLKQGPKCSCLTSKSCVPYVQINLPIHHQGDNCRILKSSDCKKVMIKNLQTWSFKMIWATLEYEQVASQQPGESNWQFPPKSFQKHVWLLGTGYNHFAPPPKKYQLVAALASGHSLIHTFERNDSYDKLSMPLYIRAMTWPDTWHTMLGVVLFACLWNYEFIWWKV